jgi:hypothetical protein
LSSFYIEDEGTAEEDEDSQYYCGLFNLIEDDVFSKERRTYGGFNKPTVNHFKYGSSRVVHTTGEIGKKYTEAGPTNESCIKSGSARDSTR